MAPRPPHLTKEHERLAGLPDEVMAWRRWGPYVAERSWGTGGRSKLANLANLANISRTGMVGIFT